MTTLSVSNPFHWQVTAKSLGMRLVFKYQDLQIFSFKINRCELSNFHSLNVVGRGSEAELQV